MQYVALFAGPNMRNVRLVCAVSDPETVVAVAKAGLRKLEQPPDPVLAHLAAGSRGALEEVIRLEERDGPTSQAQTAVRERSRR